MNARKLSLYLFLLSIGTAHAQHTQPLNPDSLGIKGIGVETGSVDVIMDDGTNKQTFHLDRPWKGLLIPPGLWRDLENFSGGAVLMCLASEKYDAADYIRDYDEFLKYKY